MEAIIANETVTVYDKNGVFAVIGQILSINDVEFDIREHNTKELQMQLNAYVFEPDYSLLIFECIDTTSTDYIVKVNNSEKSIPRKQLFVKFETVQEHLLNNYIVLGKENPLRENPYPSSPIIINYVEYFYEAVEVSGNWLKLRCFFDCEGCPDGESIEGWVKWKDDSGKIIVEIFYVC
jgi:hypothetical protein